MSFSWITGCRAQPSRLNTRTTRPVQTQFFESRAGWYEKDTNFLFVSTNIQFSVSPLPISSLAGLTLDRNCSSPLKLSLPRNKDVINFTDVICADNSHIFFFSFFVLSKVMKSTSVYPTVALHRPPTPVSHTRDISLSLLNANTLDQDAVRIETLAPVATKVWPLLDVLRNL